MAHRLHLGLKSRVLHSISLLIIIFHIQRLSNGAILWYLPCLGKAKWLIPTNDNQYIMLACQDHHLSSSIFHFWDNHFFIDGHMVTPDVWQTSRDFSGFFFALDSMVPGEISGHHTRTLSARRRRGSLAIH